jgi:hypothetical protein
MTIKSTKSRTTEGVSASLHPRTGNLRLAVLQDGIGWVAYFFDGREAAVEFLEQALELVDPTTEGGSDEN